MSAESDGGSRLLMREARRPTRLTAPHARYDNHNNLIIMELRCDAAAGTRLRAGRVISLPAGFIVSSRACRRQDTQTLDARKADEARMGSGKVTHGAMPKRQSQSQSQSQRSALWTNSSVVHDSTKPHLKTHEDGLTVGTWMDAGPCAADCRES